MAEKKDREPAKQAPEEPTDAEVDKALEEAAPTAVVEALKDAPPQVRRRIFEMGMIQSFGMGPATHPLFNKFSSAHIDKFLDYTHEDDQKALNLRGSNRWFHLVYVLVALVFFVFLVLVLGKDNPNLLTDIVRMLVAFAGGFGGGFGVKSYMDRKK